MDAQDRVDESCEKYEKEVLKNQVRRRVDVECNAIAWSSVMVVW